MSDRRVKWWDDARAVLAILSVVSAVTLQGILILVDTGIVGKGTVIGDTVRSIPTWMAATVSAVVGFYFGARGGSSDQPGDTSHNGKEQE